MYEFVESLEKMAPRFKWHSYVKKCACSNGVRGWPIFFHEASLESKSGGPKKPDFHRIGVQWRKETSIVLDITVITNEWTSERKNFQEKPLRYSFIIDSSNSTILKPVGAGFNFFPNFSKLLFGLCTLQKIRRANRKKGQYSTKWDLSTGI